MSSSPFLMSRFAMSWSVFVDSKTGRAEGSHEWASWERIDGQLGLTRVGIQEMLTYDDTR